MNLHYEQLQLNKLCENNKISYLALFGSHARGEEGEKSDIDLLTRFDKRISLMDLAKAEIAFEDFLGKPVDLVLEHRIKPRLEQSILKDLIPLYGKR